jgi:hypothetical protein
MGGAEESLRIKVLRGGTVTEIAAFLTDLEGAYNALYAFEWTISNWQRRRRVFAPFFLEGFFGLLPTDQDAQDVLPEYRLELTRISIQSPGWAEVIGALNRQRD